MGLTDFYYINFNINMNSNIFKMTTRMDNIAGVVLHTSMLRLDNVNNMHYLCKHM